MRASGIDGPAVVRYMRRQPATREFIAHCRVPHRQRVDVNRDAHGSADVNRLGAEWLS
jgi:hypothetical protein